MPVSPCALSPYPASCLLQEGSQVLFTHTHLPHFLQCHPAEPRCLPGFGIKDYSGQRPTEWSGRYVHATSWSTESVLTPFITTQESLLPHSNPHCSGLSAGLSIPSNNSQECPLMDRWEGAFPGPSSGSPTLCSVYLLWKLTSLL